MAGEDRGNGTCVLNNLTASNLNLCFILFGKIRSCEKEWVWGWSNDGGWFRIELEVTLWRCNSLTETSNSPCGVNTGQGSSIVGDIFTIVRVFHYAMPRPH